VRRGFCRGKRLVGPRGLNLSALDTPLQTAAHPQNMGLQSHQRKLHFCCAFTPCAHPAAPRSPQTHGRAHRLRGQPIRQRLRRGLRMRVLLVDDHHLIRAGMLALMRSSLPCETEFVEGTGYEDARAALRNDGHFDFCVIDVRMDGVCDSSAIERLCRAYPLTRWIVLSAYLRPELITSLKAQETVFAILSKDAQLVQLTDALAAASGGVQHWAPHRTAAHLSTTSAADERLTARQRQIYALVREGKSNKAIALSLGLSVGTVRNSVSDILKALAVENRVQAARLNEWLAQ
jgi:DNA-binding NarL/FixJ family response regulator